MVGSSVLQVAAVTIFCGMPSSVRWEIFLWFEILEGLYGSQNSGLILTIFLFDIEVFNTVEDETVSSTRSRALGSREL